jgi:tetratricopeptide (TPR) repeat protein
MRRAPLCLLIACTVLGAQGGRLDTAGFAGDPKGVLAACAERLEALKPKDGKYLAEAGRFQLLAGNVRKGEDLLRFAEMMDPKDREVLRLVGQAFLRAGRRKEALDAYDKVLHRDGGPRKGIARAGIDLAEGGLPRDAERFMDAYALLENNDWETFIEFGRAHLRAGARRTAAAWFQRALILKPAEERAYLEIGKVFAEPRPR